jgi:ribonucleoside-triphosphate reductase
VVVVWGMGITDKYLSRLPDLAPREPGIVLNYMIGDDIEGWADSLEVLLSSYFVGNQYSGYTINFIYDHIRDKGMPLKTGGGKAPGPDGLRTAHENIEALMDSVVLQGITRMSTIVAYDVQMFTADAVLSGGVRRSATSVIFAKDDEAMLNAKTGNWLETNPQRKNSNNSALLLRDSITPEEFAKIYERTKEWGEPGYVFADNEDMLFNPCFEIAFIPVTEDGECGVQFCNLTSINGARVKTAEDFYEFARAAAIIGTVQATYTDYPYLSPVAKQLTEEEALLGVSITGMMDNPHILLDPECQRRASQIVLDTNARWSGYVGINPAARACAIKPEGSGSLAVGTVRSGIHAAHSKWMWRRVQMNRMDNVYQFLRSVNPHLCEPSVWSANGTDDIVAFPIYTGDGLMKSDLDALRHLEIIRSTQENWVLPGTSPANKKNVHHNVSCTVIVAEHEWDLVRDYLYENRKSFAAVSLLAASGDKDYAQPPFEAVISAEEAQKFHEQMMRFVPVDYSYMREDDDVTTLAQELACSGVLGCEIQ